MQSGVADSQIIPNTIQKILIARNQNYYKVFTL